MKISDKSSLLLDSWFSKKTTSTYSFLKNEKKLTKSAEENVLFMFRNASIRVPAYKDFLQKHKINPSLIKTVSDFKKIPCTTKANYIEKYGFKTRCWDGNLGSIHMISTSSGTSGTPHFWPRNLQNEIDGAFIHELIFKDVLNVGNKKTLFINGFPLGNWIAGTFTTACVNLVAWKDYPITIMSPGYDLQSVINTVEVMHSEFELIVVSGHTPFLKEIIDALPKKVLKKTKIKLLGTGQAITERWRSYIMQKIGQKRFDSVINLYGSADAALMGFETYSSIAIRRILSQKPKINFTIFGNTRLPSLYNYDPRFTYFDTEKTELCITKNLGCPLLRYNIQDEGGLVSYGKMQEFFHTADSALSLPFVYLFGRDKFMVKIYGANVYSEHVEFALTHKSLHRFITGRYILEMGYSKKQNPEMICKIELNPNIFATSDISLLIQRVFIDEVRRINSEYNYVLEKLGKKVFPRIELLEHGDDAYFPKGKIKKTA